MKRRVLWSLLVPVLVAVHMTFSAPAWAQASRIYMGFAIPKEAKKKGCWNTHTEDIYRHYPDQLTLDELKVLKKKGVRQVDMKVFDAFLKWVNKTYGQKKDFGYTVFDTRGFYQGAPEQSRVMLLFFARKTAVEIGFKFQRAFCQDSVYVNTMEIKNTDIINDKTNKLKK